MVNIERALVHEADRVLRGILEDLPGVRVRAQSVNSARDQGYDLVVEAASGNRKFRFLVQAKSRVTPQTALSVCAQLRQVPATAIPVIFAPTISSRVAEIIRGQGVGYADRAGNCWLRSLRHHLLIDRQGFEKGRQPTPAATDPFSPKSSRIVRALLSQPMDGWQVRKLAVHPDVQVSPGLVVKVKRALVEEGYGVERDRLLYLRDPIGLLNAWAKGYPGPAEQTPLYLRGDTAAAEHTVTRWCRDNSLQYALAGLSAAWRLAPEVRYTVPAVYVEDRGFDRRLLEQLAIEYGGKPVDTGPNFFLWRPFDPSVFAGIHKAGQAEQPVTSALQTFLDLKQTSGRGQDAADAVFDKHLRRKLHAAAKREAEEQRGPV